IQDSGEPGLAGVVATLYVNGAASLTTTTNASGFYSFTGLTPGSSLSYVVGFSAPVGYTATLANVGDDTKDSDADPITGKTQSVTLAPGENNPTLDAGFYIPSASLGDFVFVDTNKNGVQDAGEPGIPGVVVTLVSNGTVVATTTTNASGVYSFTGLTPGVPYSLSFTTPVGYTATLAQQGGDDTKDSDINPITGVTRSVTLAPGENNPNLDAGFFPACPTNFSLVVSNDATICNGDAINLVASTPVPKSKICWYLTPFDGTAFATVDNGVPVSVNPTTTTVYYVEVTTEDGCRSARKPVVITVTTVPTPICLGNIKNTCPSTTVDLTKIQIENRETGLVYEWYTSMDRSIATRVTNLTAVGAGKLYLFAKSGNCYSNPTVLTVEIVDCNCQNVAGVDVGPGVAVCAGDVIPLKAILSGSATSVTWASNGTGTFSNPSSLTTTYTPSKADMKTGNVMLTATTNDPDGPGGICQSATSSLIAQINKRPKEPVNVACDDTIVCQGSSTKLVGFAPGSKINWYDQDGKLIGTTQSGSKLVVTPAKTGSVVYYAEAFNETGCVSDRSSITLTVGNCLADLAVVKQVVTAGPYSVGQKITYSITVNNNGPVTANSVSVNDVLPATLSFVSSTPAGQYNAGTGIWTIGTMTANSNRNLLIEATINASGSIKNTAIVNSPDNDPKYAQNDTSAVIIDVIPCNVQPPLLVCAITEICKGGTTTLTAKGCEGGTIIWSNNKTGETMFASPFVTTTYTASCVVGKCTSAASNPITVTVVEPKVPTILASASTVCPGTSVTLTASGCEGGTIVWSDKTKTGASIVVTPYGKTTYTAQCVIGSCPSNPATKTIDITTDIPTPTIICSTSTVCPGETVTLTVQNCVGTPYWSSTTAITGSIIVTPTVGNNSYSVYCKTEGGCVSKSSPVYTINVVAPVTPTVTASTDTVCVKGAVILTAANCNGTVKWNVKDQTGPSITVYPTTNISYFAWCESRTCQSQPSNTVDITVVTPTAPIISVSSTTLCSGNKLTLTAKGCAGTVTWYGIDGLSRTGASVDIYPTATATYYATCKIGKSCESEASNKVRVTVSTSTAPAPVVTASSMSICSGGIVSLTATGCEGGTVKWSDGQTGPVASMVVTPNYNEFYALCTPAAGAGCGTGKSNVIKINVTSAPKPTVICSTDTICPGETVTLTVQNCVGTPHWSSTTATTGSIVVAPTQTTSYSVFCTDGTCSSETSKQYTITVIPVAMPTVTASATTVEQGGTVTLTASGCNGEVIWSANDINGNNKGAVIVVRPEGTQTYYAQCKYRTCLSDPSVTITINPGDCAAKAGTLVAVNGNVCGTSSATVAISATPNGGLVQPTGYSVLYVLTKGAGKVVQQTSATPQFIVSSEAAEYTIHTLVYNANAADKNYVDLSVVKLGITTATDVLQLIGKKCAALDVAGAKVKVSAVAPPVLSASSFTVCSGNTVSLTATGCEGGKVIWSDGSEGATYSKAVYSDMWLTATCTVDGCTSAPSASAHITLGTPAIPIIVSNKPAVCVSETVSLTATGCEGGSYIWSNNTTGSLLTITPTTDVSFRVRCKVGECLGDWSAYTTIKVGAPAAPTISVVGATGSTTACFGAPITLVAEGCGPNSYVTWSNNQVGQSITVSLAGSANFTAQCCNSNQCKSAPSNSIAVTILPKVPQPTVVDKTNACPFVTVDLATAVTSKAATAGGVFEYYTDASLSSGSKVANPAAVGTGTYYVVEKTTNGCVSLPVAIHVQINTCNDPMPCDTQNPATANAGVDASVCAAKTYQLSGVMGGAGKTAHWTTSGSGSFDNSFALNAVYTASAEDILSGKVTLTLTVKTANPNCPVATDNMLLTIDGIKSIPVVTVAGGTKLCFGDSVTLKAPAGAAAYKWSNNATTQNIVVKASGVYSVQLFDAKGCSSVKSEGVVVNVAEPVMPPLVSNLRNTCPSKIVDLTKALSSPNAGSSYIYRICECTTSNIVMRPDSVCEGTYWIVERNNASGCLSAPAKVVVKVFNCAADTLNTDVSIAKLASTAFVKNGAPVTYTITVTNNGTHTAKNIDVRDVLPKGLELLPVSTPAYKVSNGVITKRIDSLKVGESQQIVFAARITVKGKEVVNKAEITYLDNNDTNLANNTSSVTVKDTSSHKASLIGLAKAVLGQPTTVGDSLIKVSYSFVATNFGDDTLRKVRVADDLAAAFAPNTVQSAKVMFTAGSTLKADPAFTGATSYVQLIDSTSYILPGASQTFKLDVVVKRTAGDTTQTFKNTAYASAMNSQAGVWDQSVNGGDTDPDNDGNPTNNAGFSSFTLKPAQPQGPAIGLALAVVKVVPLPDSSYNVTYKATIKNYGDVALTGVVLTDSLLKTFASPTSYSVVGAPVVGAGSTLVANAAFNGGSDSNILTSASQLAVGAQDTVLITVNIKPNGNNGPFYSSATVVAQTPDLSQVVKDISNNGFDPAPAGSLSTTVRFDLPTGLIGVSKYVGTPTMVSDGIYDIPYTITVSNLGSVPLKKVQVVDNLSETFGHGALIVSNQISVTSTGSVAINPAYTGQGLVTKMLIDSLSTLEVGAKSNLSFTVRVDVRNADSLTFFNMADATALTPTGQLVQDMSTAGTNNDPDNDLDPRNNSTPTPVALNGQSTTSFIGVAMTVRDTVRQSDGSFNVTYQVVVKAYGPDALNNVSVSDTLSKVFNSQTGATYSLVKAPFTTSTGSALKLNPDFNGGSDPLLVLGDSTSVLAAGKADTIRFVINVASNGSTTTFLNTAYAYAKSKTGTVSDVSTSGVNPDLNGNGNPTDSNEREATPLNLPQTFLTIFIPEGFSPNGDGINDLFVIRGVAGLTVSLEVYNRWGHLVYTNDDYKNDWDGKPNTGIAIASDANGVPDGTYYYVINTSDGRKFVRYMTINR
ncbi:SdrD B-like domain-containing protein, partial [Spirosoma aerophilum]